MRILTQLRPHLFQRQCILVSSRPFLYQATLHRISPHRRRLSQFRIALLLLGNSKEGDTHLQRCWSDRTRITAPHMWPHMLILFLSLQVYRRRLRIYPRSMIVVNIISHKVSCRSALFTSAKIWIREPLTYIQSSVPPVTLRNYLFRRYPLMIGTS